MGQWAPDGFRQGNTKRPTNLREAVERLSPKAKQAMYTASNEGIIARGTWDGCAFNEAGKQFGHDVNSVGYAAGLFEMKPDEVSNFINIWDSYYGTDEQVTSTLRSLIVDVGLSTPPNIPGSMAGKSFVKTIHKSEASFKADFDGMVAELSTSDCDNLSDELLELQQATEEARSLLFA